MLNMKRIMVVGVLALGMGVSWWLLSPLWLNDKVNETSPVVKSGQGEELTKGDMAEGNMDDEAMSDDGMSEKSMDDREIKMLMLEGTFYDGDDKHHASGMVKTVYADGKNYLRFEEFNVTNGPDLYVSLVQEGKEAKDGLSLGKLKGNVGNQNYEVPKEINLKDYQKIVIWCKAFNVDFGYATLH